MRQSTQHLALAVVLVLSIPWTGPAINAHLLEHEAELQHARAAVPPHLHEGIHFEAAQDAHASPHCFACLRSHNKGTMSSPALTDGPPDAPRIVAATLHEFIAPFRLAGSVAARAPPALHPDCV